MASNAGVQPSRVSGDATGTDSVSSLGSSSIGFSSDIVVMTVKSEPAHVNASTCEDNAAHALI
jgi:hypothetical protein